MPNPIYAYIEELLQYGMEKKLVSKWDVDLVRNRLFEALDLNGEQAEASTGGVPDTPIPILEKILGWAAVNGRLEADSVTYRDLMDTKLMGCLTPSQSEVIRRFIEKSDREGIEAATDSYYQFAQDVHYIRTDRIAKNQHWYSSTPYGKMEITINLSKPEKDPKAIAAAKQMADSRYPDCLLCKENVGYAGRVNHPARQNHRIIPVGLNGEEWFLQYSPYVYYKEHCIVFAGEHKPMRISKETFVRLLDFTDEYPHYFLGSNADLPIVGGSILSHDHFQGGRHDFPMAKAEMEKMFSFPDFPGLKAGIVKWPMSVVRLQGTDKAHLVQLADHVLNGWKAYSDPDVNVYASSGEEPHNTITPIARRRGGLFELDLVLRNNRTSEEHPMGIFHPHQEVHHIKKENIGLIEVMGLAVLPGRLTEEMKQLSEILPLEDAEEEIRKRPELRKHLDWALEIKKRCSMNGDNAYALLQEELGKVFAVILEHAGVFKRDEKGMAAFTSFIEKTGGEPVQL
ncbi:UDP-glucose--hexose-1-phosphate uridylyltransferase [Bacillus sp. FJAT-42376]|uniref:UDP-glucose--hexose-1-phosphate uridylyltransferase n=1 Tax=Bacillus sp. FJAT-42376 TaxID=2014076 RepID=UPI000F510EF7|nr:UDP-glucose--hexose-1-phosphate uridylyltransferase [Bacillus sp. FJAT-42376]AZB40968.1 UDP-glucose--hexose-1-phosphate uridylyltransferase [Bacillus sp. FJAT-42376]